MKHFAALSFVIFLAACAPVGTDGGDDGGSSVSSQSSSSSSVADTNELPEGEWSINEGGNPEGTVYVTGYPTVETINEPLCETDCTQYEYVFFHILESGNADFDAYLETNEGNSYLGDAQIGLGCLEGETIGYANHSDEFGMRTALEHSETVTSRILAATEENPVSLELIKLPLSGGMGAPACYSHFAEVSIWTEI